MKFALATLLLATVSLPACASPPHDIRPGAERTSQAAVCQPAPCATLNAAELNFIGPLLIQNRDAAIQQAKAYDQVIQHLQSQIAPQKPPAK